MRTVFVFGLVVSLLQARTLQAQAPPPEFQPSEPSADDASAGTATQPYEPMSLKQRFRWAAKTAVSPRRMTSYMITSAIGTAENSPKEYGPHWDGLGKRFGLRVSTGATSLLVE